MSAFMRSRLSRAVLGLGGSGLVAAGVLVAAAGPAVAQALACGSPVTASVTLTASINCTGDSTDNALTIESSGVTVDLNGHSILGPGASAGTEAIVDTGGYSDVTVENGTISNFATGADIEGSSGADLTGITVHHVTINATTPEDTNGYAAGVYGTYLSGASIQQVTTTEIDNAIELADSQDSVISHDHATDPDEYGIGDQGGADNTISDNTLTHASGEGIYAEDATGDVIQANVLNKFCGVGIALGGVSDVSVTGNTVNDCYQGILDDSGTGDTFSGNTGSGNYWGLAAYAPSGETYSGNRFNGGEYGIETDDPTSETLTGNTTDGNSDTGIYVYSDGGSGYAATLSGNTANNNRYGLYSLIVTAGSGNRAAHNKVVNCYNVTCAKSGKAGPRVVAPPHLQPSAQPLAPPARP